MRESTANSVDDHLRRTFRGELIRFATAKPVGEALAPSGLAMVVALQFFDATALQKGTLAGAFFWGLLAGPLAVFVVGRVGLSVARAMALLLATGILGAVLAAAADDATTFLVGAVWTAACLGMLPPLQTALWRQNAPGARRGRLFSWVSVAGAIAAFLVSAAISAWMGDDPGRFRPVFLGLAVLLAGGAWAAWRIPSRPLDPSASRNPLHCLHLLWRNPVFGYLCLLWMFMGLGNLMTLPLRVEFAGASDGDLQLSPGTVLMLTMVLPEVLGLGATLVWGRLFDRINFIVLRMAINAFFFLSILIFFQPGFLWLVIGSALYGIAKGGGQIAWNLWVTRFSEPDRTADYMAVHTFLTGSRGLVSGFLSFGLVEAGVLSIQEIGYLGAGLILVASLALLPIVPQGRLPQR